MARIQCRAAGSTVRDPALDRYGWYRCDLCRADSLAISGRAAQLLIRPPLLGALMMNPALSCASAQAIALCRATSQAAFPTLSQPQKLDDHVHVDSLPTFVLRLSWYDLEHAMHMTCSMLVHKPAQAMLTML